MLPIIAIVLKVLLTATIIVSATIAAERMRPIWGGVIATIPLSSGAAHVMLAATESSAFVSKAALGSLVTSIAAFAYLAVFVLLAPKARALVAVSAAFFTWLAISLAIAGISWTAPVAMIANLIAFAITYWLTRDARGYRGDGRKSKPSRMEIVLRALAAGTLATVVSVTARLVGPAIAGMLAVFPVVYVSVAYILHRKVGGAAAAATMASAVLPLVGVALTFLTLSLLAPLVGNWPAIAGMILVSIAWPLGVAMRHLHLERKATT